MEEPNATGTASTGTEQGLWQLFDQQATETASKRTSSSDAVIETQQCLKHKNIDQKEDPLMQWKQNSDLHPQLKHLAQQYTCISKRRWCQLKGYCSMLENLYQQDEVS